MNPMGAILRVTIHHSGFEGRTQSEAEAGCLVRGIQREHMDEKHFADIGYHYVIDWSGRWWEGRSVNLQGAHAGDDRSNRGNIGICVLGDFQTAYPSSAQRESLVRLVRQLLDRYGLSANALATHQEVRPASKGATECPGRHLQDFVDRLRNQLLTKE